MNIELIRFVLFALGIILIAGGYWMPNLRPYTTIIGVWIVRVFAVAAIGFMIFLWFNHITFPLNLDLMEGTILQHVKQVASSQFIYSDPTPAFVPFAYNPLYYVLSIPFVKLLGLSVPVLRLVAILAMFGIGAMIFVVVKEATTSNWWAIIAVGLFAIAYRAMDSNLDNAHADGWFVFSALVGTYVISKNRSYIYNLLGVAILVASFWFKQHGVIFVFGGLAYLLWRDGWVRSIGYGLVAALLGGVGYLFVGPVLFGPEFQYFTYQVPRQWSEVTILTFLRYIRHILLNYPILAFFSALDTVWRVRSKYLRPTIWHFQFIAALLTGVMGSLDPGSANNVYIPMGVLFIIMGTIGIYEVTKHVPVVKRHSLQDLAFITCFAVFMYAPATEIVSSQVGQVYQDFISTLKGLNGQVYGPYLGQLQADYTLVPGAHWVALEDMVRGPGRDEQNHPTTRALLSSVIQPDKPAYIISPNRLETDPLIGFLTQYYVLDTDFGERFKALSELPGRFSHGWPEYLYRYDPVAAKAATTS